MVLTIQQTLVLHEMTFAQVKEYFTNIKNHTRKKTKKAHLVSEITNIVNKFAEMQSNLNENSNKEYVLPPIEKMTCVDLRQIHGNLRKSMQITKQNKKHMIDAFNKLSKEIDFFVQY